jgi:hypothetical protein
MGKHRALDRCLADSDGGGSGLAAAMDRNLSIAF